MSENKTQMKLYNVVLTQNDMQVIAQCLNNVQISGKDAEALVMTKQALMRARPMEPADEEPKTEQAKKKD